MTDKVQKIKEWISKTQDGLMDAQGNFEYPEHEGAYHILCNLDAYIDSLQEEPISEDLEKAAKQYSFYIPTQCEATETWKKETEQHFKDGAKWQLAKIKSITLDDLGEFINELSKQFPEVSFAKVCKIATRTAKWLLDVEF